MTPYNCHNLVAVHDISLFIHRQQPVCVTVKSKTYLCFLVYDSGLQFLHMGGSAVCINICSVRVIMDCHNLTAQFLQCLYGCVIGCAFCTVRNNFKSPQIHIHRSYRMVNIFLSGIGTVFYLPDSGSHREFYILHSAYDHCLYFIFQFIGKLIAVSVKEFNSVKFYRIMRSRNYHTCIYLIFPSQVCNRRRRKHPYIDTVRSYGTGSSHQRIRQHIP